MSKENKTAIVIVLLGVIAASIYWLMHTEPKPTAPKNTVERVILPKYPPEQYTRTSEVQNYLKDLRVLFESNKSILPLPHKELDSYAVIAQELILKNKEFLEDSQKDGQLLHNDMMSIRPALIATLSDKETIWCKNKKCYEAIKYNFATNATTKAIIDVDNKKVLAVSRQPSTQPDISLRLTRIAQSIALNAPEIKEELGKKVARKDITMANVRGSLNGSVCENSNHLCVAPTIVDHQQERALWAIIDLTDLKLVAAKWAALGKTSTPAFISERTLQNRHIMKNYCKQDTLLEKNGWKLRYRLTGSDGLEVRDVSFRDRGVVKTAKIVDWHVSYKQDSNNSIDPQTQAYIDGRRVEFVPTDGGYLFGYNDAMGCPMFSTSVVLAFNAPQIRGLLDADGKKIGFYLVQDFRNPKWPMACNYRYENRHLFYNDGTFATTGVNIGRGCGDNALYRPVFRIDMASSHDTFYTSTQIADVEQHFFENNSNKTLYKIVDKNTAQSYTITPIRSPKTSATRATTFITEFKQSEGDTDLLTLGSCCNLEDDGIEQFMVEPESLNDIVIWHVPHITNSTKKGNERCWADTHIAKSGNLEVKEWPCSVGLKFAPGENK